LCNVNRFAACVLLILMETWISPMSIDSPPDAAPRISAMKVVAILALIAVVVVALAPGVSLSHASLRLRCSATHALRSTVAVLRPVSPRAAFIPVHWLAAWKIPSAKVVVATPLFEIDCTWIC
jgi:hypothetical protein